MLHKEVPYYKIYMLRKEANKEGYPLPEGYYIETYQPGKEEDWIRIQMESGHIEDETKGKQVFAKDFAPYPEALKKHMFFIVNEQKECVGTAALWFGERFAQHPDVSSQKVKRLHWVAVKDAYSGKGLAKALVSYVCNTHQGNIYLDSQTWSFPAIHIYEGVGFARWNPLADEQYKTAWEIIDHALKR